MSYKLTWLPAVLEEAGLKVAKVNGWETRGHQDVGEIQGVMCHHTAGSLHGNMPSLNTVVHGRSDLSGPLANLALGRDGTWYVIAAGRAYHAGPGIWMGITAGNSHFIGIEAENTGRSNDFPWPDVQLISYHHGVAAILKKIRRTVEFCVGHKEYATPHGRKSDPDFDMHDFRMRVLDVMNGGGPKPHIIPKVTPLPNGLARPTLRRGGQASLADTKELQNRLIHLGLLTGTADGLFGPRTEAAVREFQRRHGLVPDGIVGPKSWQVLGA